jgi:hypothetical protein
MSEAVKIRSIVDRVVNDVFAAKIPGWRDELIQYIFRQLEPALESAGGTGTTGLEAAVSAIHEAVTQGDVLSNLLDGAAGFSGRAALFVARGATANGWQARGFSENEVVKTLTLDLTVALAGRAAQQRLPAEGPAAQFDGRFVAAMGAPLSGQCQVLPLIIRDKVAAVLYADAGPQPGGSLDGAALQVLIRTAGTWLELLALRKSAGVQSAGGTGQAEPVASAAAAGVAGTTARTAMAIPGGGASDGLASPQAEASLGAAEEEIHRKARRFAKLLVDEIKLYNQAKVKEGKQNRDLYNRLKDDIDKSRASFDQRYAQTPAAGANYFTQELIRNLADNDPALLGSNFSR